MLLPWHSIAHLCCVTALLLLSLPPCGKAAPVSALALPCDSMLVAEHHGNQSAEVRLVVLQLMAAEANGEKVVHSSPASDMWALGVLAYEMFAGYGPAAAPCSQQYSQIF